MYRCRLINKSGFVVEDFYREADSAHEVEEE